MLFMAFFQPISLPAPEERHSARTCVPVSIRVSLPMKSHPFSLLSVPLWTAYISWATLTHAEVRGRESSEYSAPTPPRVTEPSKFTWDIAGFSRVPLLGIPFSSRLTDTVGHPALPPHLGTASRQ